MPTQCGSEAKAAAERATLSWRGARGKRLPATCSCQSVFQRMQKQPKVTGRATARDGSIAHVCVHVRARPWPAPLCGPRGGHTPRPGEVGQQSSPAVPPQWAGRRVQGQEGVDSSEREGEACTLPRKGHPCPITSKLIACLPWLRILPTRGAGSGERVGILQRSGRVTPSSTESKERPSWAEAATLA